MRNLTNTVSTWLLAIAGLAIFGITGCDPDEPKALEISTDSMEFVFGGDSKTFTIESNVSWTVASSKIDWLTAAPASGSNDGTVTVTAAANPLKEQRQGVVTVTGSEIVRTINVTQNKFVESLSVSKYALDFTEAGGEDVINVTANSKWSVTKISSGSTTWFECTPNSGDGDGKLAVKVSENPTASERTGMIVVKTADLSDTIRLKQAASAAHLNVSQESIRFSAGVETHAFDVTSNVTWSITRNGANWFTYSSSNGTSNNSKITVTSTANPSITERTAVLTIKSGSSTGNITREISVTQAGAAPSLTVSGNSLSFSASSGQQSITVTSNIGWEASSDADWAKVSPASASGNGTLRVSVETNTVTSERTAVVTVRGGDNIERTIQVTQAAAASLNVSTNTLTFSGVAGEGSFGITSNGSWEVSTSEIWLQCTPTSGSNDQTVKVTVTENPWTTQQRTATITVRGGGITRTINVTQSHSLFLSTSTSSMSIVVAGGENNFTISSNTNWSVRSSSSWVTVSPSSGSNNGTITVKASANTSTAQRTATLTINSIGTGTGMTKTVQVSQSGAVATGSIAFYSKVDFGCGNVTVTINGHGSQVVTGYYYLGYPTCGDTYTATFRNMPPGVYTYSASCNGRRWSGTVTRTGSCHTVQLN